MRVWVAAVSAVFLLAIAPPPPSWAQALGDAQRASSLSRVQELELNRRLAALAASRQALSRELGLRDEVIRTLAIDIFGAEPDLDPDTYASRVVQGARLLPATIALARALDPGGDPTLAGLRAQAIAAAEAGRLLEARRLQDEFAAAFNRSLDRAMERPLLMAAANYAAAAQSSLVLGDFDGAASRFALAAERAPATAEAVVRGYRLAQMQALIRRGEVFGDPTPLRQATDVFVTRLQPTLSPATDRAGWIEAHLAMGKAHTVLGNQQGGQWSALALTACQGAAAVINPRTEPALWVRAQVCLGEANGVNARRGYDVNTYNGIRAYDAALAATPAADERQRAIFLARRAEFVALDAMRGGPGVAMIEVPESLREGDLQDGIEAYERALTLIDPDVDPELWVELQLGLERALRLTNQDARRMVLIEALAQRLDRERTPALWAKVRGHRGLAHASDGDYDLALAAFEEARAALSRERNPGEWAQNTLWMARTHLRLGDRDRARALAEEAEAAYRSMGDTSNAARTSIFRHMEVDRP